MPILEKCSHCQQFNKHADSENDLVCIRCKKAIEQGLTELPDEKLTNVKSRLPTTEESKTIKVGSNE